MFKSRETMDGKLSLGGTLGSFLTPMQADYAPEVDDRCLTLPATVCRKGSLLLLSGVLKVNVEFAGAAS